MAELVRERYSEKESGRSSNNFIKKLYKQRSLVILALPILILTFVLKYIPMAGIFIAFKDINYSEGIFKSPWCGFNNFKFMFASNAIWNLTFRTIGYNLVFILLGTVTPVVLALLLNELKSKSSLKIYQTAMFIPHFPSWVIVSYIAYVVLNPAYGVVNHLISIFGIEKIDWYSRPGAWILILPIVSVWKHAGYNSIIYYSSLLSISNDYYEAAAIDGASRWQMTTKISIPFLKPIIIIMTVMSLGNIMRGDFGLFYLVPQQEVYGVLTATTDILDTYIYRALKISGEIPMSTAVGLYQSAVGCILVLLSNKLIRRVDPERALY
jgi:putative aldouronate transport system permease protein